MKTTARMLTGVSLIVPRTETVSLIKSRIHCNIGFAYGLMEKYELSDSRFPPVSFVMLKTGKRDNGQEEKVQIVNLLLQILRSGDFVLNTAFYHLILGRLQAELHFYFDRLGRAPGSGREYLKGLYEEVLKVARERGAGQPVREGDRSRALFSAAGYGHARLETEMREGRSRGRIEERRSRGGIEERRSPGGIKERRNQGGIEEERIQAGIEERRNQDGIEEERNRAGIKERRSRGRIEEERNRTGIEEGRSPGGIKERRNQGRIEEERSQAGIEERRSQDGIEEERNQAGIEEERIRAGIKERRNQGGIEEERNRAGIEERRSQDEIEEERIRTGIEERRIRTGIEEEWKDAVKKERGLPEDLATGGAEEGAARRIQAGLAVPGQPGAGTERPRTENELAKQPMTAVETEGKLSAEGMMAGQDRTESMAGNRRLLEEIPDFQGDFSGRRAHGREDGGRGVLIRTDSWEERRIRLEQRLLGLWRELHGQAHMPSSEAAGIYGYLERLTEERQQAMAQALGYDRAVLLERLKGADNQEWRQMRERIEHCLELAGRRDEAGAFHAGPGKTGEKRNFSTEGKARKENRDGTQRDSQEAEAAQAGKRQRLEQWLHSLSEWIGYLERHDWEILSSAVGCSQDSALKNAREAFSGGQKQAVMEYFDRIESMEELLPVLRLIYREEPLKEMARGWLPKETCLLRRAGLLETARQLVASPGTEEKGQLWDGGKDFSGSIKAGSMAGYAESGSNPQAPGHEQWKACLIQWFEYMEMGDWNEAVQRIQQGGEGISDDAEKAFGRGQKAEVIEFLEQAEWAELLPVADLVYRDPGLARLARGWLPERDALILAGNEQSAVLTSGYPDQDRGEEDGKRDREKDRKEKLRALARWRMLLETAGGDFPWKWTKAQYVKMLEQVPAREAEAILLPEAELLYPHKGGRQRDSLAAGRHIIWKEAESGEGKASRSLAEILRDDVRKGKIRQRILEADQERWLEIRDATALKVYRTALQKQAGRPEPEAALIQAARSAIERNQDYYKGMGLACIPPERGHRREQDEYLPPKEGRQFHGEGSTFLNMQPGLESQIIINRHSRQGGQDLPPGHRTLLSREEDGVSYVPAELVTARLSGEQTREKQLTPSPRDIEVIAEQVKQETVKDIRFVSRGREKNSDDRKNEEQLDEVLKRLSRQQKELEQLKQIQARLIRSTEPGRMAEVVMKQFKGQLQIEKLRKGG